MKLLHWLFPTIFPAPPEPTTMPEPQGVANLYQEIEALKPSTEALRRKFADTPPSLTTTLRRARENAERPITEGRR